MQSCSLTLLRCFSLHCPQEYVTKNCLSSPINFVLMVDVFTVNVINVSGAASAVQHVWVSHGWDGSRSP